MAERGGCFGCVGKIGCAGLVIAVAVGGYLFREPIVERVSGWWREATPALPSTDRADVGAPTEAAVRSFSDKAALLGVAEGPDSVVLTPNEVASFIGGGLDWTVRRAFDSLRVEVAAGRIRLHTRYEVAQLPSEAIGVLDGVLQDREALVLGGPLFVEDVGQVRWLIDEVRIRGVPLPATLVSAVVGRIATSADDESFAIAVPREIAFLRVTDAGVILKRARVD